MRLEVSHHAGVCIINDAYNANPDSMRASLETFEAVTGNAERRVVVLGDMLELGEYAADSHKEVVDSVAARPHIAVAVLVGPQMRAASGALSNSGINLVLGEELNETFAARVAKMLLPGDAVLLKGSRRMGLERLIPAVKARPALAHA
jgi:UDP-N-acetylmuramyl pentapeptide synthase